MNDEIDIWGHYQDQPRTDVVPILRQRRRRHWTTIWFAIIVSFVAAAAIILANRTADTDQTTQAAVPDCVTLPIERDLVIGVSGDDVTCLQQHLTDAGYPTAATGTFDPPTETAVKAFQRDNGRTVDGVVGPRTGDALGLNIVERNTPTT